MKNQTPCDLYSFLNMHLKNRNINKVLQIFPLILILACSMNARSELVKGVGEYLYGPETSKAQACNHALEKAKIAALSSVMGESISNEQQLYCKELTGKKDIDCEYHSTTWSLIDGDIKLPKKLEQKVEERFGESVCIVSIEAEVIVPSIKPDPNFDVQLKTNQSVFRVGDDFIMDIESTVSAYYAIFNWLPYEKNQITRISVSGNADTSDSDVLRKTAGGKFQFKQTFTTNWSKAYTGEKKYYDEWVLVVVTKKPFKWLSTYDFESFKEKLSEIPNNERRIKRLGYKLFK